MEENYLAKWLDGQLHGEELRKFEESEEFDLYQRIKSATEELEVEADFHEQEVWQAVRSSVRDRRNAAQDTDIPEQSSYNMGEEARVRPLWGRRSVLRIAAAVAALFALSYFWLLPKETQISAGLGEREIALLPDQSRVTLNAESHIQFNASDWEQERSIELKGQAFFDVEKGQKFTVRTPMGEVSVLGTEFDVLQREHLFRVYCYEGRVSVRHQGAEYILTQGQSFQVIEGEGVWRFDHGQQQASWLENTSTFRSLPLGFVLEELGRQYDVEVILEEGVPVDKRFTGSFRHDNLRLALDFISMPTKLTYTIEKGQVRIYGANGQYR